MSQQLVAQALDALKSEDFATARARMQELQRVQPLELQHYQIKGLAEIHLSDWNSALTTLSAAAEKFPDDAQVWANIGVVLENLGNMDAATLSLERSLKLDPARADATGNLSNIYCRLGRFAEAETLARQAMQLGAPRAQILNSLGLAFNRQNKFGEAKAAFEEALGLEPKAVATWINLANLYVDQLDFEHAFASYAKGRAAAGDGPLLQYHEAMARLLAGDFARGWPLYEARLELPYSLRIRPPCPRYNGEGLIGKKILLLAEQGFGDVIQFCRYGAFIMQAGADVTWVVPKNLQRLMMSNMRGKIISEDDLIPAADFYIPILSLPSKLKKLMPANAPRSVYLRMPQDVKLPEPDNDGTKIGLVWSGATSHERDFERSIPLSKFASLIAEVGGQFYAPFTGPALEAIRHLPVMRLDHLIKDFADTAALIQQLDCLITVDTAIAHLAGAMGVKTFLLLPYSPDWRWGTAGATTPWYQSLTLLRQAKPGDWDTLIGILAGMLAA